MPTLNNLNVVFIRDRDGNFTPVNGFMGSPGRGIVSIERTSGDGTSGSIDVYTITYTDKTTSTFEVYNGSDGKSGATPEQIAAAIEQYLTENPFVKKETDPTVFRWAKAELFDKNDLVDPAGRNSFVTIDDIEYYRYNASAQNFEWNNPNPQTGSVTITARGMSQYGGTGSTRLRTFFDDGTEGEQLFIIVNGESRTVTYTTPSDKVLAKITGNYDMENWVLLDMSVMSCLADYPAPKGTVKTVNGISPDGNGNIQFDAADVNAVPQNQGGENAGKFLGINESGEVVPVDAPSGGSSTDIALGITGAAVGQIARITAVDDAGMPTAWDAVEFGGGSEWKLLRKFTLPDDPSADTSGITWVMCSTDGYTNQISSFEFNTDESGNTFALTELIVFCNHAYGAKINYFSISNQDGTSGYGNLFCNRSIFGGKSALTPMVVHTKIEHDIVLATLHTGDNLNGTGVIWTNFGKIDQQLPNKIITVVKLGTFKDSSIKPGSSYEIWGR